MGMMFQTVEVETVRLRTARRGAANASPILFLHGGAGSMEDFDPLIERFSEYDCILMDSRGHGGSTLNGSALNYPLLANDAAGTRNVESCHGLNGRLKNLRRSHFHH